MAPRTWRRSLPTWTPPTPRWWPGCDGNAALLVEPDGAIRLDRLAAAPEPAGMDAARDAVAALLPRIDYPS